MTPIQTIVALAAVAMLSCVTGAARAQNEDAILKRSLVAPGDPARILRILSKAERGEPITVAVIGGSITQGAAASDADHTYGSRVAQWWREQFPRAKVTFVNAGIGATGTPFACVRARRDLLSRKPDFVVVEFGVNDGNDQTYAETYEGLVRQILKQPNQPGVVMLFMMNKAGGNAQEWQSKVGKHYNLPMVSYRDALWPEIEAGRMKWTDISPDEVHPNDYGHEQAARFVTHLLETILERWRAGGPLPAVARMPRPLFTDLFEFTSYSEAPDLKPLSNEGWTLDAAARCWRADAPGSAIEFEAEGRQFSLTFWRVRGATGRARVTVDGGTPVTLEAWFDATWGGYTPTEQIARGLPPGRHRIRIEVLDEKAPLSTGHEFRVFGIGAAGVTKR